MKLSLLIVTTIGCVAHAGTYEERASRAAHRSWEQQLGRTEASIAREESNYARRIQTFANRHGGATKEITCGTSKYSCHDAGEGTTECMTYGENEKAPLASMPLDGTASIGNCDIETSDGWACKTTSNTKTITADCYDRSDRQKSFKL